MNIFEIMENERYQPNMKNSLLSQILSNVNCKKKLKKIEPVKDNVKFLPFEKEKNDVKVSRFSKIKTVRTSNPVNKLKDKKRKFFSAIQYSNSELEHNINKEKTFYPFSLSTIKYNKISNKKIKKHTPQRNNSCHFQYSEESLIFFRKEKNIKLKDNIKNEKNENRSHHRCNIYWINFNNKRYQNQPKSQTINTYIERKDESITNSLKGKKILVKKRRKQSDQLSTKVSFYTISLRSSHKSEDLVSVPLSFPKKIKTKNNLSFPKFNASKYRDLLKNDIETSPYAKVSIIFNRFSRNRSIPSSNRSTRTFYPFYSKDVFTQNI